MPQHATYQIVIKLNKAIGFLIDEYDFQISDIARAMPANLGNLTSYLRLRPGDKLPKRKTLESHYENLKIAFRKELRPLWEREKQATAAGPAGRRVAEEPTARYGKGLSTERQMKAQLKAIEAEIENIRKKLAEMDALIRRLAAGIKKS